MDNEEGKTGEAMNSFQSPPACRKAGLMPWRNSVNRSARVRCFALLTSRRSFLSKFLASSSVPRMGQRR